MLRPNDHVRHPFHAAALLLSVAAARTAPETELQYYLWRPSQVKAAGPSSTPSYKHTKRRALKTKVSFSSHDSNTKANTRQLLEETMTVEVKENAQGGFSNKQMCTLFKYYSFLPSVCPKSDCFCPRAACDGAVDRQSRRLHRYETNERINKDESNMAFEASFFDWCLNEFDCGQYPGMDNSACVQTIRNCCSGWYTFGGITFQQRCDAFHIVEHDGEACDDFQEVICPEEMVLKDVCADRDQWESFCSTYSLTSYEQLAEKKVDNQLLQQILLSCKTAAVHSCCCGPFPPLRPPVRPTDPPSRCNSCKSSGACVDSSEVLVETIATAEDGAIIRICPSTKPIKITNQIDVTQNEITVCCNGPGDCILDGQDTTGIFLVTGDSFAVCGLELRNGRGISDSTFDEVIASHGGNIYIVGGGQHEVANSMLLNGSAVRGGNIAVVQVDDIAATITIRNTTFRGGQASDGGGGLFLGIDTVLLEDVNFVGNSATALGGAFAVDKVNSLSITGCAFFDNAARVIGGAAAMGQVEFYSVSANRGWGNIGGSCVTFYDHFKGDCLEPIDAEFGRPLAQIGRCNDCAPIDSCVKNYNELVVALGNAPDDAIVGICPDSEPILIENQINVTQNNLKLCCVNDGKCTLDAEGATGLLNVSGDSFALCDLELRGGSGVYDDLLGPVGGNLYLTGGGWHEVTDSTLLSGKAQFGGNIAVMRSGHISSNIIIQNSTIQGGQGSDRGGGALFFNVEDVVLNGVKMVGNSASEGGGGMFVSEAKSLHVEACTFLDNTAKALGGACYMEEVQTFSTVGNNGSGNSDLNGCGGFSNQEGACLELIDHGR